MSLSPELCPTIRPGVDIQSLPLGPVEGFVFSRINGVTSIKEIGVATGLPLEQVEQALTKLKELGAIDLQKVEVANPRSKTEPKTSGAIKASPAAEAQKNLERIELLYKGLERLDYYKILGVSRIASDDQIKMAFMTLSRDYHPDRFYNIKLGAKRDMLDTVFAKLSEAYEVLKDPEKRRSYDEAMLPAGARKQKRDKSLEPPKKNLVADSARMVELAEQEIRNGNFQSAAQNFKLAAALAPNNRELVDRAEFISGLGTLTENLAKINADPDAAAVMGDRVIQPLLKRIKRDKALLPLDESLLNEVVPFLLRFDDNTKVARELAEALAKKAPRVGAYMLLGFVLERDERNVEALKVYEKVLVLEPDNARAKRAIKELKNKR